LDSCCLCWTQPIIIDYFFHIQLWLANFLRLTCDSIVEQTIGQTKFAANKIFVTVRCTTRINQSEKKVFDNSRLWLANFYGTSRDYCYRKCVQSLSETTFHSITYMIYFVQSRVTTWIATISWVSDSVISDVPANHRLERSYNAEW